MQNLEKIRENYRNFPDSKIEYIARNESKGLRIEVLGILRNEIQKRGLSNSLISWIETETKTFEYAERKSLINKIQHLNCPKCSENKDKLYGFEITQIVSALLITNVVENEKILCLSCGRKEKLKAISVTFLFGWWSRAGILATPYTIIKDTINFLFIKKISNEIINRLIDENTGYFRRNGIENETLIRLIKRRNEIEVSEFEKYKLL